MFILFNVFWPPAWVKNALEVDQRLRGHSFSERPANDKVAGQDGAHGMAPRTAAERTKFRKPRKRTGSMFGSHREFAA